MAKVRMVRISTSYVTIEATSEEVALLEGDVDKFDETLESLIQRAEDEGFELDNIDYDFVVLS